MTPDGDLDPEPGSQSDGALDVDATAVLGDDPVAQAQAEPVPRPIGLVVKNGSKIFERTSGGIPHPSSASSTRINLPRALVATSRRPFGFPDASMACKAFISRLRKT